MARRGPATVSCPVVLAITLAATVVDASKAEQAAVTVPFELTLTCNSEEPYSTLIRRYGTHARGLGERESAAKPHSDEDSFRAWRARSIESRTRPRMLFPNALLAHGVKNSVNPKRPLPNIYALLNNVHRRKFTCNAPRACTPNGRRT